MDLVSESDPDEKIAELETEMYGDDGYGNLLGKVICFNDSLEIKYMCPNACA